MGDFEIFNLSVSLGTMIYQAFLFTILVFILKKFFLAKLLAVMENRKKTIDDQLHLAERYRTEAEKMLNQQKKASLSAKLEAQELILKSHKQAAAIVLDAKEEARKIRTQAYLELKNRRGVPKNEKNIS